MKYIRRVKQLRFGKKKLPQMRNVHFYIWLSHTENESIHISVLVRDRIYITGIWTTINIILSFKLGKANEIYEKGKTIKILLKEVTSNEKYPLLYMVI